MTSPSRSSLPPSASAHPSVWKSNYPIHHAETRAQWRSWLEHNHKADGFHLVRLANGEVLALLASSPHLGHPIPWLPSFVFDSRVGWFRDPRHGETFDMAGIRVFGPAPRGMDRAAVEVRNGTAIVNLGDVTAGTDLPSGYEFQTGGDWGPLTPR